MNEQTISLDVTKRPAITPVLYIRQGDAHGTTLNAEMYDNGEALNLASYSVRFAMRTPNGSGYYEVDGSTSGNVASFVIDETYAGSVSGVTDVAYVEVIDTDTAHTSSGSLRVVVLPSATEDTDPAGAYVNGVDRWLANAQQSLMNMENAANAEVDSAIDRLDDAVADVDGAVSRANAAAAAAEGVVVDAVPLMSKTVHGGAKLGHGLRVSAGALGVQLVDSGSGTATVQADGDYLHALEVDGKSEQDTTTGKNIAAPNLTSSVTSNGINWRFDGEAWHATGTANNNSYAGGGVKSTQTGVLAPGTYTAAAYIDGAISVARVGKGADSTYVGASPSSGGPYTFTVPDGNTDVYQVACAIANGRTVSDAVIQIQLEAGSTATAYEPYTGGKASPSPDYPQEIRTVKGINLLPKAATYTENGITFTVNPDGSVKVSGTATATAFLNIPSYGGFTLPAGTYTISGTPSGYSGNAYMRVRNNDTSSYIADDTGNGATFTLSSDANVYALIRIAQGVTINDTFRPQIERGSTAHDYVPYGALGLKVVTDMIKGNLESGKFVNSSGVVTDNNAYAYTPQLIPVSQGFTYTVTNPTNASGNSTYFVVSFYDANGTWKSRLSLGEVTAQYQATFVAPSGISYIRMNLPSTQAIYNAVHLNIGSSYVPDSVTPIPLNGNVLASLPDGTHDELTVDDAGHVTIKKATQRLYFDGSSNANWNVAGDYSSVGGGFWQYLNSNGAEGNLQGKAYSNRLVYGNTALAADLRGTTIYGNTFKSLRVHPFTPSSAMTIAQLMEWLTTNPLEFFGKLATPQTIDLGYIDMPKLSEGSTIELLATIDPPIDAEWWAVGAGAVHESNVAWGARVDAAVAELAEAIADL